MRELEKGGTLRCPVYQANDYTVYLPRTKYDEIEQTLKRHCQKNGKAYAGRLTLLDEDEGCEAHGRVLACPCFDGRYWSLTIRLSRAKKGRKYELADKQGAEKLISTYKPSDHRNGFLNSIQEVCDRLYEEIFEYQEAAALSPNPTTGTRRQNVSEHPNPHGLVVVTGRTASAKSQIARGLIYRFLEQPRKGKRRPHLLTLEDPIEEYYYKHPNPERAQQSGLDYTPREKGKDADDLAAVVIDALRQTPTLLFVGETRDEGDWRALLRFAGTGHLVVTTAHAGSLTEAMGNIFKATDAKTPAVRSDLADKLLALVHLRPGEVEYQVNQTSRRKKVLLPALWRHRPIGAKTLMAEGRASLLPHNPGESRPLPSTLGRSWFARQFLKEIRQPRNLKQAIIKTAIEWDIEGV